MSKRQELRHALASYLAGSNYSVPVDIDPDRKVAPRKVEELVERPVVTVVAGSIRSELDTRGSFEKSLTIGVGIQQKIDWNKELEQFDQLDDLVEDMIRRLEEIETGDAGELPLAPWAVLDEIENDVPYEPDEVLEGVFTSLIVATFIISGDC